MLKLMPPRRPTLLVILDGFGVNPSTLNNGIAAARTPRLDHYFAAYPHTKLQAGGRAVGLPEGQMGNSEVGHLTLGAGAIMRQDLVRIDDAINDGTFFENPALLRAMERAARAGRPLHLLGLVSEGGVHSHSRHLLALIELCARHNVAPYLHMLTDGRDTPPQSAIALVSHLDEACRRAGGQVATVMGRFYGMDRDQRWERTEASWRAIVRNAGQRANSLLEAIQHSYAQGISDEFISPTILPGAQPLGAEDTLVFFNFRRDRTRQMTAALASAEFAYFDRGDYHPPAVTTMTLYDNNLDLPYVFGEERPETTLGQTISHAGLAQFHCAETEKYAHVTYFLNGGRDQPYANEERCIVPSPKVTTYDLAPAMSAREVADAVIDAMRQQRFGFVVVNFANGDMVGHSAVREAVIEAVETLDRETGRVLDAAVELGYAAVVTADHGNCELLVDPTTGQPHTQHTTFPVPLLVVDQVRWELATEGGLRDVAPTVLQLMGLPQPGAMTGHSLLIKPQDSAAAA